jgi:hypothetical protein
MQPLIEIRNSELFCEKMTITAEPGTGLIRLMYVSWHNDTTYLKEITLPNAFI